MRTAISTVLLLLLWTACAGEVSHQKRPDRTNLMTQASDLQGSPITVENLGSWSVRTVPRSHGATVRGGRSEAPGAVSVMAGRTVVDEIGSVGPTSESLGVPGVAPSPSDGDSLSMDRAKRRPVAGPIRAGSTDDNLDHAAFLAYLAANHETLAGKIEDLRASDRRSVLVETAEGRPVPGAEVLIVDEDRDRVIWRGRSYGDGRVPLYLSRMADDTSTTLLIEVRYGDQFVRQRWNGAGMEVVVRMPGVEPKTDELALDVVFLIDTTGSMSDEIAAIKSTLLAVTAKLEGLDQEFDLRYGAVLYRDVTDAYVTKAHPFTADIAAFDKALKKIEAHGGGDMPESMNQGLAVAVDGMMWRQAAAKIVFLLGDAPPHLDYGDDVPYGDSLEAAVAQGIRIHAVAASGLDAAGTAVFRQIAQFTRGKFVFIEYGGSVEETAAGHGVTGKVKSNNLDDILFEQIRDEIAHWGRRAG